MALIDKYKSKIGAGSAQKPLIPTAPTPSAPPGVKSGPMMASSIGGALSSALKPTAPAPTAPVGVKSGPYTPSGGAGIGAGIGIGGGIKQAPVSAIGSALTKSLTPPPTATTTPTTTVKPAPMPFQPSGGVGGGILGAIKQAQQPAQPVQPAPITNAAISGGNPATGFGGATYGTSGDVNKAISSNESRLASDPAFKESEINRTLAVMAQRKAQGMDTSQQEKYLSMNLGYNPNQGQQQPAPIPSTVSNANSSNGVAFSGNQNPNYSNYGQYVPGNTAAPPKWATAEEETWLKNQIAGMQGLSDTYRGQLNSALGENDRYIAGQIDAAQQMQNRRGGLYSGGYDYQAGTLTSEGLRRQADLQNQYGNQISSIAQQINNLQQAQPDILRQRIQEYINNDRNYALNYAGTFGNLGGVNTQSMQGQLYNQDMTNQQFNWQKKMDEAGLTGLYNGASTLAGKQANWNAYQDMVNQTGRLGLGPAQNWSNLVNNAFTGGQTMGGQQNASSLMSEQQNRDLAPRDTAMQEWAQAGYATPNVSEILGVPINTPTNDASYRDLQYDLDSAKQYTQGQGQTVSASTAGDMLSGALRKTVGVDEYGDPKYGVISDPTAREDAFVNLYNNYGIRGNDMITALTKAGYTMAEINKLKSDPHYQSVFQ